LQILQNEQQTWVQVVQYIKENNVDCEHWSGDTLDVPITPRAAKIAKETFEKYKAAGGKVDHIKVTEDPEKAAQVRRQYLCLIDMAD
jgi:hypothetical protein